MHKCLCYNNLYWLSGMWLLPIKSFMTHLSFSSFSSSSLFFTVFQFSGIFPILKYYWKFLEHICSVNLSLSLQLSVSVCVSLFFLQHQPPLWRKSWWIQRCCSATKLTTWRADSCRDAPLIAGIRVFVSFRIKKNDLAIVRFSGHCAPASTICH